MRIEIKIKPGKKTAKVIKQDFASYEVWVKSPPIKGAANRELLKVLSDYFNVKVYDLRIVSGLTSPMKIIEMSEN
jgi:hypothetical protein